MAMWRCSEGGGHEVKLPFEPKAGEKFCPNPDHNGAPLQPAPKTSAKQPGRKGTAAYDRARRRFNNVVCSERCFFSDFTELGEPRRAGHRCTYPLDGHHLVGKSFLTGNFHDLPEDEFLAIIFNPLIGAPLCQSAHPQVTVNAAYIYYDELRVECIEFCESVDRQWEAVLLPSGIKRGSMLERLKLESPVREAVR